MAHIRSEIAEKQEIIKQFIQKESMAVDDMPLDPRVDAYVTTNFLQGTLSRLLAFDTDKKKYVVVKVDSDGNLKVTASVTNNIYGNRGGTAQAISANLLGGLFVDPSGRDLTIDVIFNSLSVADGASATHAGIDIAHAAKITVLVATNRSMTIRPQISDDNIDFYDVKNEADADLTFNCTNEKIAFRLDGCAKFLRMFVTNSAGAAGTITMKILGQA